VVPILWFYEVGAFSWPIGGSGLHLIKSTVF
jgi:hypothetical protein